MLITVPDMSELLTPASGKYTSNGIPQGYSSLTPFLALANPEAAIAFYTQVFEAQEISVQKVGSTILHAELQFSCGRLQLGAANPDYHLVAPDPAAESVCMSFGYYCPNVDKVISRAVDAGAVLREPVTSFISGDRYGSIRDPFGIRWTIMTRVEDLSDKESKERVTRWLNEMSE